MLPLFWFAACACAGGWRVRGRGWAARCVCPARCTHPGHDNLLQLHHVLVRQVLEDLYLSDGGDGEALLLVVLRGGGRWASAHRRALRRACDGGRTMRTFLSATISPVVLFLAMYTCGAGVGEQARANTRAHTRRAPAPPCLPVGALPNLLQFLELVHAAGAAPGRGGGRPGARGRHLTELLWLARREAAACAVSHGGRLAHSGGGGGHAGGCGAGKRPARGCVLCIA